MMPMTNAQVAAQHAATKAKYATRDGAPPIPPVLSSYSYGRYQLTWQGESTAEVRVENTVVHSGTRDECVSWIQARGVSAT